MTSSVPADDLDVEMRRAVETAALAYGPPESLAGRTLHEAAAMGAGSPSRAQRWRARLDARGMVAGVVRRRRGLGWALATAVALVVFALVGGVVTDGGRPAPEQAGSVTSTTGAINTSLGAAASGAGGLDAAPNAKAIQDIHQRSALAGPATAAPAPPVQMAGAQVTALAGPPVVRTAEAEVRVPNGRFDERWGQALAIAGRRGGFVTNSRAEDVAGRLARGTVAMRVPADQLETALADLRALGSLVRQTTSADDVSGQVVDFDARLRAAQANELQLLEVLKQTRSVADGLVVRNRLNEVRTEIEGLAGQRARLQEQVDLASVAATVYERQAAPTRPSAPEGRLGQGWRDAGDGAAAMVAGMLVVGGWLVPLAALAAAAWFVTRRMRRRLV